MLEWPTVNPVEALAVLIQNTNLDQYDAGMKRTALDVIECAFEDLLNGGIQVMRTPAAIMVGADKTPQVVLAEQAVIGTVTTFDLTGEICEKLQDFYREKIADTSRRVALYVPVIFTPITPYSWQVSTRFGVTSS